jgi:O-antigen/teichoic acid export membrane protein
MREQLNILQRILKFKLGNGLARNALWVAAGQGTRLAIQAAYFTLIARSLGVKNYGAFVGVVAVIGVFYPFGSLGRGNILVKNVARNRSLFPTMWGTALITTLLFGSALVGLALVLSCLALPPTIPTLLILLVAVSDIIGLNIILMSGQAFQSFDQLNWLATINVMISASRLMGALILVAIVRHPSALQWGYVYFVTTWVVALTAFYLVSKKLGLPKAALPRSGAEMREGLYFSAGSSAQTVYNDIDKTMLARFSTLQATGIYGAAYRLIDVSFSPIWAFLVAAYPSFFRAGAGGIGSSCQYAKPLLLRALGFSLLISTAILLFAGFVPLVLGAQFAATAEALRWLSPLPMLKSLHYFLSDILTTSGHQAVRTATQAAVALFNVLINLWLIPAYSWRGAAASSIVSDAVLACSVGAAVFILLRRSQRDSAVRTVIEESGAAA